VLIGDGKQSPHGVTLQQVVMVADPDRWAQLESAAAIYAEIVCMPLAASIIIQ
jgi:hypothetical protein